MAREFHEIQGSYVAELRRVLPEITGWFENLDEDPARPPPRKRWPTGPAGHPRVLAIFRKHYLEVEALNDANANTGGHTERPNVLLIDDLRSEAPDVFEVVQGLVFVPIGLDEQERAV